MAVVLSAVSNRTRFERHCLRASGPVHCRARDRRRRDLPLVWPVRDSCAGYRPSKSAPRGQGLATGSSRSRSCWRRAISRRCHCRGHHGGGCARGLDDLCRERVSLRIDELSLVCAALTTVRHPELVERREVAGPATGGEKSSSGSGSVRGSSTAPGANAQTVGDRQVLRSPDSSTSSRPQAASPAVGAAVGKAFRSSAATTRSRRGSNASGGTPRSSVAYSPKRLMRSVM